MSDGITFARFLRDIASIVEKMSSDEVVSFTRELKQFRHRPKVRASAFSNKKKAGFGKTDLAALSKILSDLQIKSDRQSGASLLDMKQLTRNELSKLAKMSHVHFTKEDNVAQIKEKIIEGTIGSRLGSIAIRGDR